MSTKLVIKKIDLVKYFLNVYPKPGSLCNMVHPFRHSIMSTKMIAGRVVTKKRGYKEVFIHQNIFPVQYCSEAFLWLKGQNMEPKTSMELFHSYGQN